MEQHDLTRKAEISFKEILLWHLNRISQTGCVDFEMKIAGTSKIVDSDKTFIQQIRLLHFFLQAYWDEIYIKKFKEEYCPKVGDRKEHERWFGLLMELMARLNMLIEPEIIEEDYAEGEDENSSEDKRPLIEA